MTTTQLTDLNELNLDCLCFGTPREGKPPADQPKLKPYYLPILVQYENGTTGPLIIQTCELFSYGVQRKDQNDRTTYSLPLVLWDSRNTNPNTEERQWVDSYKQMCEKLKDLLLTDEIKDQINKWEFSRETLSKLDKLYYKKEKGKIIEDRAPMLYPRLMERYDKENNSHITSEFYDSGSDDLYDVSDLLDRRIRIRAAIRVESIFVGATFSLQLKVQEAIVQPIDARRERLLAIPFKDNENEYYGPTAVEHLEE